MFDHFNRPIIFAHRGASAYAPENTLAAFKLAERQGAEAIELDAKLTKDGQVVVIHDQTVNRTTGADGLVSQLTLEELRKLDAGSHFDEAFKNELIPTLTEVFEGVGENIFINIELTNYTNINNLLPKEVAVLIKDHQLQNRVLLSSFNPLSLIRIRRYLPHAQLGLLALPGIPGSLARSRVGHLLRYQCLHSELKDVTPALVKNIHKRACRIHVYTVNKAEDMRRLYNWGVDGIFTDDPILARSVFKPTTTQIKVES